MTNQKQDACFYVDDSGSQVVWESEDSDFYVIRAGEMRILFDDNIIRYTDQLEKAGITTDKILEHYILEEKLDMVHNPWFEVFSRKDSFWCSDPIFEIDEAIDYAKNVAPKEYAE